MKCLANVAPAVCLLLLGLVSNCGNSSQNGDDPSNPPGIGPARELTATRNPNNSTRKAFVPPKRDKRSPLTPVPTKPVEETLSSTNPGEKERDYAKELRNLVGNVDACLPATWKTATRPSRVSLSVQATVNGLGIVSRASVNSPELDVASLACVRKRIETARFVKPVKEAPRQVQTTIEYVVQSSP